MKAESFPFESRFKTVFGQRLHYVDEGSGEPILFLHGNPTWSFLYRAQIAALRDRRHCIAVDHLGFGFSDKPPRGDYSMRAHVARLGLFIDSLGLDGVTLVVQDWGGVIGLGWAVAHKPRVKRLVVMNTTGFVPRGKGLLGVRPAAWGLPLLWTLKTPGLGELFVQGLGGFVRALLPLGLAHRDALRGDALDGYLAPYQTWGSRRAHLASVRQIPILPTHPTWRLLEEIGAELDGWTVPAQIVWGMKDPVFVPWFMEEFERRLPNHWPTIRIDDASHFLPEDAPDRVTDAIRAFLDGTERDLGARRKEGGRR